MQNEATGAAGRTAPRLVLFALAGVLLTATAARAQDTGPSISGTPATRAAVGENYSFQPDASDPDGSRLMFSANGLPRWASFDRSTGRLYGRPGSRDVGASKTIAISVTDRKNSASLPPFTIEVTAGGAPSISGTPDSMVNAGELYAFRPSASDPEGQTLTFSISNKPAWATFSRSSGQLSGTPVTGDAGTYSAVEIAVSDGSTSVSLPAFSIDVIGPQDRLTQAPTISGTPSTTVEAGRTYSFTPTASDPDTTSLTFSVTNRPAWAAFDATTGRLSGSPSSSSVGNYSNIVITVSDGTATASLPAFGISVTSPPVVSGSAVLSWQPPSQNVDGSPLTDLAGYRVRYGQSSSVLDKVLTIPDGLVTTVAIEQLTAGAWYFGVEAYNAANLGSGISNVVQKLVQ